MFMEEGRKRAKKGVRNSLVMDCGYVSENLILGFWKIFVAGTHRTFPVPRNVPGKVLLFLVSSVFPYSKGDQGRYGNLYFSHF